MRFRPREIHLLVLSIDLILLNLMFLLVRFFCGTIQPACVKQLFIILNVGYILISPIFVEDIKNLKIGFLRMTRKLISRFVYYIALTALLQMYFDKTPCPKELYLSTISLFFLLKWCVSSLYFYRYSFNTHLYLRPSVIIGNNRLGNVLYDYFQANAYLGIKPVGIISESTVKPEDVNVIGSVYEFQEIFNKRPFEDAFITISLTNVNLISSLIAEAEKNGIKTHLVPHFIGKQNMNFKVGIIGNIPLLEMHSFPLDIYSNRFVKRVFDILFSLVVIILLFPLCLLIALAIKLTSRGPVFFKTYRIGVTGAPFKIYKFRTMRYDDSPDSQSTSTVQNDGRITPVGKFLRKFSLDELPQFLNVLNNDMSIVGPRPHRINLNKALQHKMSQYMMRHIIKPGITGWAQVNGWRGPTNTKIQYWGRTLHDLWYIEHWNFAFDLYIIFLTVFGKKSRKNAF
jgi:putative colanic acid biosynthesis UDP-glucose lipid carrier transferase